MITKFHTIPLRSSCMHAFVDSIYMIMASPLSTRNMTQRKGEARELPIGGLPCLLATTRVYKCRRVTSFWKRLTTLGTGEGAT